VLCLFAPFVLLPPFPFAGFMNPSLAYDDDVVHERSVYRLPRDMPLFSASADHPSKEVLFFVAFNVLNGVGCLTSPAVFNRSVSVMKWNAQNSYPQGGLPVQKLSSDPLSPFLYDFPCFLSLAPASKGFKSSPLPSLFHLPLNE